MNIYCKNDDYTLYQGDMNEVLKTIPENSIGSIVTDPPYEIGFMGKSWDRSGVAFQKETWEKCYNVLKPGGYLLAFGGCKTFHRIACAIEDAGFEIRDTIMWVFGSGFPKSMNIGLAIDKKNGVESHVAGCNIDILKKQGKDIKEAQNRWKDWGTTLKPAYEPIIIARKPFNGSLIDNVEEYGVGGLNIGECRINHSEPLKYTVRKDHTDGKTFDDNNCGISNYTNHVASASADGRFPSNLILTYDDSDYEEVCGEFPCSDHPNGSITKRYDMNNRVYGDYGQCNTWNAYQDSGSASRYFYCAKASSKDRDEGLYEFEKRTSGELTERKDGSDGITAYVGSRCPKSNFHPTVKPTDLMQYLIRLVTPKGETVLDPFMGSGSTGKAIMFENRERKAGYKFIGVELTEEYLPICKARIDFAKNGYKYEVVKDNSGNKVSANKEELF